MSRMTVVVSGYMKFGRVHDWEQKTDDGKVDRKLFRGQLSYRDHTNNERYDINAVCFKDFGNKGGLVGFLENNYLAEDGMTSKDGNTAIGGQPIEIVGYIRPAKGKKNGHEHTLNLKGGKTKSITIDNIEFSTFELVILEAGFATGSTGEDNKSSNKTSSDIDFDDIDEDDIIDGEEVDDDGDLKDPKPNKNKKKESKKEDTDNSSEDSDDEEGDFFNK